VLVCSSCGKTFGDDRETAVAGKDASRSQPERD
jgi:hypothetical protein